MTNLSALNNQNNIVEQIEFSVTEISTKIKLLLEGNFGTVRIKGEISGFTLASSGHGYFNLKDANSLISATCWKYNLSKVNFKISDGLEVVITGKISAYSGQSKYQIIAEKIEPSGQGAFLQILKERKEKLEKEGLFLAEYKKTLPFLPKKIGVITSITGAVIKDIIHRITERCGTHLIIWPVTVQGASCASEVAEAINGFNNLPEGLKPEILIIARGGGSIEDLWAFNEEIIARAAFASTIPIISAIGHETDYTILDLVSDKRAPTPTAAAEFAVPVMSDLKNTINYLSQSAQSKIIKQLEYMSSNVKNYNKIEIYLQGYLNNYIQRLDSSSIRLSASLPNMLKYKISKLQYLNLSQTSLALAISKREMHYIQNISYLRRAIDQTMKNASHKLEILSNILDNMDYRKMLARGYAVVKTSQGKLISSIDDIKDNDDLLLQLKDGEIIAKAHINTLT